MFVRAVRKVAVTVVKAAWKFATAVVTAPVVHLVSKPFGWVGRAWQKRSPFTRMANYFLRSNGISFDYPRDLPLDAPVVLAEVNAMWLGNEGWAALGSVLTGLLTCNTLRHFYVQMESGNAFEIYCAHFSHNFFELKRCTSQKNLIEYVKASMGWSRRKHKKDRDSGASSCKSQCLCHQDAGCQGLHGVLRQGLPVGDQQLPELRLGSVRVHKEKAKPRPMVVISNSNGRHFLTKMIVALATVDLEQICCDVLCL